MDGTNAYKLRMCLVGNSYCVIIDKELQSILRRN